MEFIFGDEQQIICDKIYKNLVSCFKYNESNSVAQEYFGFNHKMKLGTNFDFKNCIQYKNIPKEIKNITQTYESNKNKPNVSFYRIHLEGSNLYIKYELNI